MERIDRSAWIDALVACVLACALAAAWAWRDWANLSALHLPDADDMMRLQQIRDWIDGQSFSDLTQYRLGENGVAMHWSRLADLVPGGIIAALQGMVGRHDAELVAVIVWPALMLAAAIALTGRIARAVGGAEIARPAMIVAAIAFPASTLFVPGRIDHHNLQVVLLLLTTLMLVRRGSMTAGLVAGIATSLSLVIGMEMMPMLAIAGMIAVADWVKGGREARDRLMGFGIALCAATVACSIIFRPLAWDYPACDGFTAISARALMIASFAPIGLALIGWDSSPKVRLALALASGLALAATLAGSTPQCLSPYGRVAPLLQKLWLARVGEAQPLFGAQPAVAIGYAGLAVAGLVAGLWQVRRSGDRGWWVLLALQLGAAAVTVMQLRGAYAGSILAAPALGAAIVAARRAGAVPLIGAWLASAGMLYPIAAQAMIPARAEPSGASCTAPDLIAALGRLPRGRVMAPIDTGGPAIAETRQQLIAGAYHRDNAGNLAMYQFYRASPDRARLLAGQWHVDWVVACDGFPGIAAPFSADLNRGASPDWLRPVERVPSGARIFAVNSPRR